MVGVKAFNIMNQRGVIFSWFVVVISQLDILVNKSAFSVKDYEFSLADINRHFVRAKPSCYFFKFRIDKRDKVV